MATNRHVTCGGVDLADLRWEDSRLNGKSRLVGGDPYVIYLTQPADTAFAGLECKGAAVQKIERDGFLVRVTLLAKKSGEVNLGGSLRSPLQRAPESPAALPPFSGGA